MKISIASYNIYHGENKFLQLETGEHIIDLPRTAETIRSLEVDLCGLNEVRNQWGREGLCNQAEAIAKELGWHYAFAKAINIPDGEYGNALVSRYPIKSFYTLPVETTPEERDPTEKYENRVLLVAEIDTGETPLTVMICHFGLRKPEKQKAVSVVCEEFKKHSEATLFMGDLNITPDTAFYHSLADVMKDTMPDDPRENLTFSHQEPRHKIDYIFTNEAVRTLSAEVCPVGISDHRPVKVTVEI